MIIDSQTNFVYISTLLIRHQAFCRQFLYLLQEFNVGWSVVENTNDIWCRDYMPVQVNENKFVQFEFDPDYLLPKKYLHLKTKPELVYCFVPVNSTKSNLVIDGGNIVKWKNKIIVTDKIYSENPDFSNIEIRRQLRLALEIDEVIAIPKEPYDVFGHADGMVKFIDENKVLLNDYSRIYPSLHKKLIKIFSDYNIETVLLPYRIFNRIGKDKISSAKGNYINYLQLEKLILIPEYGIQEDEIAYSVMKNTFQNYNIRQINCNSIAAEGGVLNCMSWSLKR